MQLKSSNALIVYSESKYGIKVIPKVLDVTNYDQVFEVFRAFKQEFGHLDRVIVNAGIGDGRRIGKGSFAINKATVETNFISALAQCEAAVEIFREQNAGHLVVISSALVQSAVCQNI